MKGKLFRVLLFGTLTFLTLSCSSETTETREWLAPNWTQDGRIVFLEEYEKRTTHYKFPGIYDTVDSIAVSLMLINKDGTGLEKVLTLFPRELTEPYLYSVSTASVGSLAIACLSSLDHSIVQAYLVDLNSHKLIKTIPGVAYADFSPDGKRIVYQKYEGEKPKGIWIMDLESGEERCLVPDTNAMYPSWSSEGGREGLNIIPEWWEGSAALLVVDTLGDLVFS